MSESNSNIHEEKSSLGSKPSKNIKKDEWIEEEFGKNPQTSSTKKSRNNSKSRGKKK